MKNEHELISSSDLNLDNNMVYGNTTTSDLNASENNQLLLEVGNNNPKKIKIKTKKIRKENYQGILQCYVCGLEQENITEHIKKVHYTDIKSSMYGPPRQFQCQKCRLMFVSEDSLGLHICGTVKPT